MLLKKPFKFSLLYTSNTFENFRWIAKWDLLIIFFMDGVYTLLLPLSKRLGVGTCDPRREHSVADVDVSLLEEVL